MARKVQRSTLVANSPLCKMYELGLSDGEAKGRRLERQRTHRIIRKVVGNDKRRSGFDNPTIANELCKQLGLGAARSKRGKVGK